MTEKPTYEELEQTIERLKQDMGRLTGNDSQADAPKAADIMAGIHEGIYEIDMKGNFTFVNPAVCTILAYPESELIGMNHTRLMDKATAENMVRIYTRIAKTDLAMDGIEIDMKSSDGMIRTVDASVSLVRDDQGKPMCFRGIIRDITEKKILGDEMEVRHQTTLNSRNAMILCLAKLAEYRDKDVGSHLERIQAFSRILATEISNQIKYKSQATEQFISDIGLASILHDIGKVGIPDAVLLKPGKLTAEEFETIKQHSRMGSDALKDIEAKYQSETFISMAKDITLYHHERWNGKGYPEGLEGDGIPLAARIVSLVDVYDALTCKLVYKEAFSHDQAIKIIVKERGQQFDPDVVDAFMSCNKEFVRVQKRLTDMPQDEKISPPLESFV